MNKLKELNIELATKKFKNNNIIDPALIDKNRSTSKCLLYQDNLNIFNLSYRKADLSFLDEYLVGEYEKEDERITAEYFKLVTIEELINCIFLLMTLASCFAYNEAKICFEECSYDNKSRDDIIVLSLAFSSLSTVLFIIILIFKYYHYFLLYKNAKYLQPYANFFKTKLFRYFCLECILAILHPNLLFKDKYFTTNRKINLKEITYNVNDIFLLIQCLRLLYLIIIFAITSDFYSPRADRICKMMGNTLNLFFSFRALFVERTAIMLIYCSIIICAMLSYMIKIISQPIIDLENNIKLHNFGNCVWYVIITMTTVGYGDMYPDSTLGRLIGCVVAISGNVLVALIVSFFQEKTNLQSEETNALDFIQRVNEKEEVMKASAAYFKANMLYIINKRKIENGVLQLNKNNKNKMIKLVKDKIEARKRFKNLFHKFHIHFKMENDVDKIKKKIDNLDYAEADLSNYINLINIKIKELIRNINGYSNNLTHNINNDKRTKNNDENMNYDNNSKLRDNSIIHEIEEYDSEKEPEPKDTE